MNEYAKILLDHIPVGVALFDARDFRLLAANQRSTNSFGCISTYPGKAKLLSDTRSPIGCLLPMLRMWQPLLLFSAPSLIPANPIKQKSMLFGFPIATWCIGIGPFILSQMSRDMTIQLALYGRDVTASVLARQQVEEAHVSLTQLHSTTVAAHKQLEVIETVARSARASLDTRSIGQAAVDAISASLQPLRLSIHVADPLQQALRLLCLYSTAGARRRTPISGIHPLR